MIDRDIENATASAISNAGVGPNYYGRFSNGRVEGWMNNSRPMKRHEMKDESFVPKIARALSQLHTFTVPEQLVPFHSTPGLWGQLWQWFEQAKNDTIIECKLASEDADRFNSLKTELLGDIFEKAKSELDMLQELTEAAGSPVIFCHNDALADNILIIHESDIMLIDFEYGGCNYRGFDIANHWNEWAGGTQAEMNGTPEYTDFPSKEQQVTFCEAYLSSIGEVVYHFCRHCEWS